MFHDRHGDEANRSDEQTMEMREAKSPYEKQYFFPETRHLRDSETLLHPDEHSVKSEFLSV